MQSSHPQRPQGFLLFLSLSFCLFLAFVQIQAFDVTSPLTPRSPLSPAEQAGYQPPPAKGAGFGPETVNNWSGYITVQPERHLWYWFFESRSNPKTDPLILWLTGGPGCSSMIALFFENGPYRFVDEKSLDLELNPYSWNSRANILYLDQPYTTGFSYTRTGDVGPLTEREIANNMYEFMQTFLTEHPTYRSAPFFLMGESYAGHYVPSLAAHIVRANDRGDSPRINLKGMAVGNGLVDAEVQYQYYASYAYDYGVISAEQNQVMQSLLPGCLDLIRACSQNSTVTWQACVEAHIMCNYAETLPVAYSGRNVYDVRRDCGTDPLCYDMSQLDKLLANPEVKRSLAVPPGKKWKQCNNLINEHLALAGDWLLNFAVDLPVVLEAGIQVLFYNGEFDWICNWYGVNAVLEQLQWEGSNAYRMAANTTWIVDGSVAGSSRAAKGLTFLKVNKAGHMVPMDQPKNSFDLLKRFIGGYAFDQQSLE